MSEHDEHRAHSIALVFCDDCNSWHLGMFDADYQMICMADLVANLDGIIHTLQMARTHFSEAPQRLQ